MNYIEETEYILTRNQRIFLAVCTGIAILSILVSAALCSFCANLLFILSIIFVFCLLMLWVCFLKKRTDRHPDSVRDYFNSPIHTKLQLMEDDWNKTARWISYLGIAAIGWLLVTNKDISEYAKYWMISSIVCLSISLFFSCVSELASMFYVRVHLGFEPNFNTLKEILFSIVDQLSAFWHIIVLFSFALAIIFAIGGFINIIF